MVRISDTGQQELDAFMGPTKGTAPANVKSLPRTTGNTYAPPVQDFDIDPYASGLGGAYNPTQAAASAYSPQSWLPDSWQAPAPRPAMDAWADVSQWSAPPEPYSLGFEGQGYQSPIVQQPAYQGAQTSEWLDPWEPTPTGGGLLGSLGGGLSRAGSGLLDFGQQIWDVQQKRNASNPTVSPFTSGGDGGYRIEPTDAMIHGLNTASSGNYIVENVTGYNLDDLPYNLGYVTDAINPLGVAAVAAGPTTPIIGSTLGGGIGRRALGEIGIDIASRVGAEQAAGDFGESIPYFGDLPPVARGLIGGLAGGIGAAGGVKAIDNVDLGAAGRSLAENNPFAAPSPSAYDLPTGAIDPSTGRPFEWQAPMGGADVPSVGSMEWYDWIRQQRASGAIDEAEYQAQWKRGFDANNAESAARRAEEAATAPQFRKARETDPVANPFGGEDFVDFMGDSRVIDRQTGEMIGTVRMYSQGWSAFDAQGRQIVDATEGFRTRIGAARELQNRLKPAPETPSASSALSADAPPVMDARRSLLDALDSETKLRTSGVVEAEISAGRGAQAAGIRTGLQGLSSEATLDDALSAARQGASTGPLRKTVAAPLDITPEVQTQLVRDILDNPNLREFDTLRALKALDKLTQGDGLQPNEIKLLGRVFGEEVAEAARQANVGRISSVATLTEADLAEIARRAEVDGRGVARLEVEAMRQSELADNLQKQSRMDPTNKRLAKAADDARARAIAKANEADRKLADSIERQNRLAEARQQRTALAEEQKATRAESRAAEARDIKNPNHEQLIKRAEDALNKADISPELKAQQLESVKVWLKGNEAILDAYGDNAPGILRSAYASLTGDVTDSWTSTLLTREAILKSALEAQGMSTNMAKLVARRLRDAEVARRFGQTIPEHIQRSLDEAKGLPYGSEGAIGGLASISQELKNTQFGIGDLAVFGQQGLKAGTTNAPQLLAGMVNRMLAAMNWRHVDVDGMGADLPKRLLYQLDGVSQSSHAITDLTNEATLISRFGKPGAYIDAKAVVPFTRWLTDLQFNTILTSVRNVAYEGNLVLAKMAGADITDPVVRARAAEWANAATGAGKLAQKTARAQTEKAFLLSPSMRRAQIQQIGQVARGLTLGSRVDRVLAAATIASAIGSTVAAWKLLNDWVGQDEFEWDPSKPGFGSITLPGGTVINLFPQEQVVKALARSLRTLVDDGFTESDLKEIGKLWGNLGISSASPGVRPFLAALGVGYDPDTGYEYGGLGDGSSFAERLLKNAPIPPIGTSLITEGFDKVRTPFELLGVNAYEESEYAQRDRAIAESGQYGDRSWNQLTPAEQKEVTETFGRVYSSDPDTKAKQVRADANREEQFSEQSKYDAYLKAGQRPDGTPYTVDDWKKDTGKTNAFYAGQRSIIWEGSDFEKETLNPLDRYYAARDKLTNKDGEVNWDVLDMWLATQSKGDRAYIEQGLTRYMTPTQLEYRNDTKYIADTGYFDLEEGKMQARIADPYLGELVRKWGYSQASIKAQDVVSEYTTAQEADDQAFRAGQITGEEYRARTDRRKYELSAAKDVIFAGLEEDGEPTGALEKYYAIVDKHVAPNGQDVDWDAVDAEVAQLTPEEQAEIENRPVSGLTPVVKELAQARKTIAASGYWDIPDEVGRIMADAGALPAAWPEGWSAEQYFGEMQRQVTGILVEAGMSQLEAQAATGVVMGKLTNDYNRVIGKLRGAFREQDPELSRLLLQWGYWQPGQEDTAELIASGVLR